MPPASSTIAGRLVGRAGVGQDRGHGSEDLALVDRRGRQRLLGAQQRRREEEALPRGRPGAVHALPRAENRPRGRTQLSDAGHGVGELRGGGQGSHAHRGVRGISRRELREPRRQGLEQGGLALAGDQDAAHRGALLSRLLGHLPGHVAHEEVEQGRAGLDVRRQHRGVQAVGLDVDAHARSQQVGPAAQRQRGRRRTGKGEDVLRPQPVEQVARRADDELERAGRKQAGLQNQLDHSVRRQRRRGGRLGDHRHAGEEGAGELLGEAPGREVERVDVDRDARGAAPARAGSRSSRSCPAARRRRRPGGGGRPARSRGPRRRRASRRRRRRRKRRRTRSPRC